MLVGTTCAVLAGTLVAAVLLLGRFVLLVTGFFFVGTVLIAVQDRLVTGWQGVAALCVALAFIVIGRPGFLRRHPADTGGPE